MTVAGRAIHRPAQFWVTGNFALHSLSTTLAIEVRCGDSVAIVLTLKSP